MKNVLAAAFFWGCFLHGAAQTNATIPGEYIFREELGLHSDGIPTRLGNLSYFPREPLADTTVLHKLCLNDTHGAFMERDTSMHFLYINIASYQWVGRWELYNDSLLVVTFDRLVAFYPFSISGGSSITIEKLIEPLVLTYSIADTDSNIYLSRGKDEGFWDFRKAE